MLPLKQGIPKQEIKSELWDKKNYTAFMIQGARILEDYLFYVKIFMAKVETREKKE